MLASQKGALQIRVEREFPVVLAQIDGASELQNADIVVENVDVLVDFELLLDRRFHFGRTRNVGPDRHGRSALDFDQRTRLLCALDIQIDGDDARAFTSIGERAGLAIARLMSGRRSRSKN